MTASRPEVRGAIEQHQRILGKTQFGARDDFVLHCRVKLREISAVSCHSHHEIRYCAGFR